MNLLLASSLKTRRANETAVLGRHVRIRVQRCVYHSISHTPVLHTANLRTKILKFRGFDSSTILILRGEILMSMMGFPEVLSQTILAGIILVERLCVHKGERVTGLLRDGRAAGHAEADAAAKRLKPQRTVHNSSHKHPTAN